MSELSNLATFRNNKLNKKVIEDIDHILHVLTLSQQSLSHFKHYAPCQEIISIMETNKTLFEMHRKKYEEAIVQKT